MALGYEAGGWEYRLGEHHIYGSSRTGVHQTNLLLRSRFDEGDILVTLEDVDYTSLYRGKRHYEFNGCWLCAARPYSHESRERSDSGLSNHLGNVQVVVSDKRISVCDEELEVEYFKADVLAAMDYYPFGMLSKTPQPGDQDTLLRNPDRSASEVSGMMPDRQWYANSDSGLYKFSFNGKEIDREHGGAGNVYDYGFRIYNPALGKFLSVDLLKSIFAWWSPYHFAGKTPLCAIDLEGLEIKYVTHILALGLDGKPYIVSTHVAISHYSTVNINGQAHAATEVYIELNGVYQYAYTLYEPLNENECYPSARYDYTNEEDLAYLNDDPGNSEHSYLTRFLILVARDLQTPDNALTLQELQVFEAVFAVVLPGRVLQNQFSVGKYTQGSGHFPTINGRKSPAPSNGQLSLDNSILYKSKPNGQRRIGRQGNDFVIFDQEGRTGSGSDNFHGHVRTWDELDNEMKSFLINNKYVNTKGEWLD